MNVSPLRLLLVVWACSLVALLPGFGWQAHQRGIAHAGALSGRWRAVADAPVGLAGHTAIWTGSQMLVWGGSGGGDQQFFSGGFSYSPDTDTWERLPSDSAPPGGRSLTAVWSGSEMIVWGGWVGYGNPGLITVAEGGRFNPDLLRWFPVNMEGAPSARMEHTAVWTGQEMIIWGGRTGQATRNQSELLNDGARYNPATDTWVALAPQGAPSPRIRHSAVWTGSRMIIWGGQDTAYLADGAAYDPQTDTWEPLPLVVEASKRSGHTAVWTGAEMIAWGGIGLGRERRIEGIDLGDGDLLNVVQHRWSTVSQEAAPTPRLVHSAVWTGTEMLIWGGGSVGREDTPASVGGARYDPLRDAWSAISADGAPVPRTRHSAVWTGTDMIVWGGSNGRGVLRDGGRYSPPASVPAQLP